jgi:gliding motility-associated-like protein
VVVAPSDVVITSTPTGPLTVNSDGTVDVAPGTASGTYYIQYTICEVSNPTNCDTATVTVVVEVTVEGPEIDAVDDDYSGSPVNGESGGTLSNVLDNDTLNGSPVDPSDVVITSTPTGPLTVNADGTVDVSAGTAAGTYYIQYTICEVLNPTNCDTATVTVVVEVTVEGPEIDAVDGTLSNVLNNDTLNGVVVAPSDVVITSTPTGPLTVNSDGSVDVAPGTAEGTYYIQYTICEVLNPTNCDTAIVTVVVTECVVITTAFIGVTEDNVCFDADYIAEAIATNGTILWTTSGDGSFTDANIEDAVYSPGSTDVSNGTVTLTMTVTGVCNTASDSIVITIDEQPYAGTDGTLEICEGETVTEAQLFAQLGDSTDLNGTWSPSLAGAGIYTYTLVAIGTCPGDTAEVVVTEYNIPIILNLVDDEISTTQNTPVIIYMLDNDTIEGGEIEISISSNPNNGTLELNLDNSITFTPTPDFIGDDTFDYTVVVKSPCGEESVATARITIVTGGTLSECYTIFPGYGSNENEGYGFSPNGDGFNDYFEIENIQSCFPDYQMEIYNRWGNIVFDYKHNGNENSEPKWWDGRSYGRLTINKGEVLPAGTYFYIIYLNKDNLKPVSGYVYLTK